jgi:hypothetical protein
VRAEIRDGSGVRPLEPQRRIPGVTHRTVGAVAPVWTPLSGGLPGLHGTC